MCKRDESQSTRAPGDWRLFMKRGEVHGMARTAGMMLADFESLWLEIFRSSAKMFGRSALGREKATIHSNSNAGASAAKRSRDRERERRKRGNRNNFYWSRQMTARLRDDELRSANQLGNNFGPYAVACAFASLSQRLWARNITCNRPSWCICSANSPPSGRDDEVLSLLVA